MRDYVDEDTGALWAFKLASWLPEGMLPAPEDGFHEILRSFPPFPGPTLP